MIWAELALAVLLSFGAGWVTRGVWDLITAPSRRGGYLDLRRPAATRSETRTVVAEQQLCVRCGHVRSMHADGLNECLAYHEIPEPDRSGDVQPCDCAGFVAAFNEAPAP